MAKLKDKFSPDKAQIKLPDLILQDLSTDLYKQKTSVLNCKYFLTHNF